MGLLDTATIAAAEKIETTIGPRAAMAQYRALLWSSAAPPVRGRALAGMIRAATTALDREAVEQAISMWASAASAISPESVVALASGLIRVGEGGLALSLADAEVDACRFQTTDVDPGLSRRARGMYLAARVAELARDDRQAIPRYGGLEAFARSRGLARFQALAIARRAALLARSEATLPDALDLVKGIEIERLDLHDVYLVASLRLRSRSRFVRAGGLAKLAELAERRDPLGRAAALAAAEHADAAGEGLTSMELDHVRAAVRWWPHEAARSVALSRLEILAELAQKPGEPPDVAALERAYDRSTNEAERVLFGRVKALASGAGAAVAPASVRAESIRESMMPGGSLETWNALDVIAALRAEQWDEALLALRAVQSDAKSHPPVAAAWTALLLALAEPRLRDEAVSLARSLLAAGASHAPCGYLAVARSLLAASEIPLGDQALARAMAAGETGAKAALLEGFTAEAWRLAAAGDKERAITLLQRARALRYSTRPLH